MPQFVHDLNQRHRGSDFILSRVTLFEHFELEILEFAIFGALKHFREHAVNPDNLIAKNRGLLLLALLAGQDRVAAVVAVRDVA